MSLKYNGKHIILAKNLRNAATPQENHLWYDFLCKHPVRFQRQKVIGEYIADFYCHKAKLVIEIDGSRHNTLVGMEKDKIRAQALASYGLQVIRFTNQQIETDFQRVCEFITATVVKLLSTADQKEKP